jgi:hypothetical protein
MAYEVFKRTKVRVDAPAIAIVPDGRIALNTALLRVLKAAGVESVLLLWDKANRRIAGRAAPKNDRNAYAVSSSSSSSASIRAKQFLTYIGWNAATRETMPVTWNDSEKMFEAELPARHFGATTGHTQKGKS